MAGRGGIGDGDLPPYRTDDERGEFDEALKEDLRDEGPATPPPATPPPNPVPEAPLEEGFGATGGGGNILVVREGVLLTDAAGVSNVLLSSLSKTIAESASLTLDSRRKRFGRLRSCALGVRTCRVGIRVLRPTACASNCPFLVEMR